MKRRRTSCVGGSRTGVVSGSSAGRRPGVAGGALAVAAMMGLFGSRASADTWDGGGGDNNWSTGANWLDDSAPVSGDPLVFAGTTRLTPNNDNAANTLFNGISFDATAGAFTLGGAAVRLGGDIDNASAAAQTINLGLVLDGGTIGVNRSGGGSLSLGALTFGLAARSTNLSTLNINQSVSGTSLLVQTNVAVAATPTPTPSPAYSPANVINIASGQTLSLTGAVSIGTPASPTNGPSSTANITTAMNFTGGGSFTVNTATNANFMVGINNVTNTGSGGNDRNVARVDMTGLSNFTYSTGAAGTGQFGVGFATRPDSQLRLAAVSNSITASTITVGNSAGTPGLANPGNNGGGNSTLFLGAGTNVLNTANLNIGLIKAPGFVSWDPAVTTGSLTLQGQAGAGSRANILIGSQTSATGTGTVSQLALAGHVANVTAGNVVIGRANNTGNTAGGAITFDNGTFDVTSLQIAHNQGNTNPDGVVGSFTMGGGTLVVGSEFILGNDANASAAGKTAATFSISNGTATTNVPITRVVNGARNVNDAAVLNVSGGTLDVTGKSIGEPSAVANGAPLTAVNISGGTLANAARISANAITITNTPTITGTPVYVLQTLPAITTPASPAVAASLNTPGLTLGSGHGIEGGLAATPATVTGAVTAGTGAYIDPGAAGAAGTLTFNNALTLNDGSTVKLDLSDTPGNNDLVNAAGGLTLGGTVNLSLGAIGTGATVGQTYTVMTYAGTLTGDETNLSASDGTRNKVYTVVPTNTTAGSIQVSVGAGSGALSLTWLGNNGNNWQLITGPTNWDASGTPEHFYNQDTVTFDDSSANTNAVQLVGTLLPNAVSVNATRNYTFAGSGSIGGSASLTKDGTGTLTVNNANTYTGGTTINAGTLVIGDGGSLAGTITNNGALAINRSDNLSVANVISGTGTLTKSGAGVLTLTGANTYTGATTISAGTIKATTGASVGDTNGAALTVASGATFDISGNTTANGFNLGAKTVHISGNGVGGTAGAIANSGTTAQNNAFNNITLDADALIAGARMDIGRTTAVATRTLDLAGHTLTVNMTGTAPIFSVLDGVTVTPGNMVVAGGGLNFERSSSTPNNGGTITLNTGTVLQAFQTTSGALARPIVLKGSNIVGSGSGTVGVISSNMSLEGNVTFEALASGAPTLTANNPLTVEGVISEAGGARSVTKLGVSTLTLTGDNTYTGGTTITGGTVQLGAGGSTGSIAGNVTNNGALTINRTDTALNLTGSISGTGSVSNLGTGTAKLSGANSYSGGTTVTAGTLVAGHGDAFAGGALNVADGALGQAQAGLPKAVTLTTLNTNASGKFDLTNNSMVIKGMADSAVRTLLQAGYNSGAWNGATGIVSTGITAETSVGYATRAQTGITNFKGVTGMADTDVQVKFTYAGDANLDGKVDIGDLGLLAGAWQAASGKVWFDGDFTYDGAVDIGDLGLLSGNWQKGTAGNPNPPLMDFSTAMAQFSAFDGVVVPEPASLGLLGVAGAGLLARRRRHTR